jgi:hypothetical protein
MKRNLLSLAACSLSLLSLTGCWVPQVIQGVRPELFKSDAPAAPDEYKISREEGLSALATRMISIAQETSNLFVITRTINTRRQQVENFAYFNVKASNSSGLPEWYFNGSDYTHFDALRRSNYTLSFKDNANKAYPFDVLAVSNYGAEPLPAKVFPLDFSHYELSVSQTPANTVGTMALTLSSKLPHQVPLKGNFDTTLSGTGENTGHPALTNINLRVDGKASLDGTVTDGQISFDTVFQGKPYNGFGTIDAAGFKDTVDIQQNGQTVIQIRKVDRHWDVVLNDQVVATGY